MPPDRTRQTEFDAQYDRLMVVLPELEGRLRTQGHGFWADWLAGSQAQIEARNPQGLVHLRSAYGGMGSLNDLFLPPDDNRLRREVETLVQWLGRRVREEDESFDWPW